MPREIDEAWIEQAIERYRRIEALRGEFDKAARGLEVTVRSPDGLVERTNADVSRSLLAAVSAAGDAARWAREKLHAETFGEYAPLAEA